MREFNKGDWIIYTGQGGRYLNTPMRIKTTKVESFDKLWIYHEPNAFSGGGFSYPDFKEHIRFATYDEIPEQHRPKLITKEEKNKLLDLIKSI